MRLAVMIAALCIAQFAYADSDAKCTVYEISATKEDKPAMDAELKALANKLEQPPFSAWNTFKLLGKHDVSLLQGKPNPLALSIGKASLMLRGRGVASVQLEVLIDDAKGNRVVSAKPDLPVDEWLVFGSGKKDGHLLALRCK